MREVIRRSLKAVKKQSKVISVGTDWQTDPCDD
jgi:hypothetical protein